MFDLTANTAQPTSNPASSQAFSVSEVNTIVADLINSGLPGHIWVEGELSNLSVATSGHRYFSLKDSHSMISCALFRNSANRISREVLQSLKNGDKVLIKANISVYKPRGSYQLIVSDIEPAGFGALAKAFIELKNKLEKAGLFDNSRKRPIPTWSKGIGVITSPSGAAIRDVLTTLQRRAPFIPVSVYPTLVQGNNAPAEIIHALQQAGNDTAIDVVLLVRGGGSLEDLIAFNDESVAMAVADCPHPVISGVGHETDFSIVDFISDYRAATPTAAAEVASPDRSELQQGLTKRLHTLKTTFEQSIEQRYRQLNALQQRLNVQHPTQQLQQQSQRLDEISKRLHHVVRRQLNQEKTRLQQYQRHLNSNNPQRQFSRLQQQIQRLEQRLWHIGNRRIDSEKQQLQHYQQRLLNSSPRQQLSRSSAQLQQLNERLQQHIKQRLNNEKNYLQHSRQRLQQTAGIFDKHQQQLKGLHARLTLLSPLGVLDRGYALVFDEQQQLLRSIKPTHQGQKITVRLADGDLQAVVESSNTAE